MREPVSPDDLGGGLPPQLWTTERAVAVVARPDDESFGLGGVLAWLTGSGIVVDLACFTAGEASTLGADPRLGDVRTEELQAAARSLGIRSATMVGCADGHLAEDTPALEAPIAALMPGSGALICLEPSGVTGHPDHKAVAAAVEAVAARAGIPVVEWGLSPAVAAALADEMGMSVSGIEGPGVIEVRVERDRQRTAIVCHKSQAPTNPVLARRLELQGTAEHIRIVGAPFEARLGRFVAEASPLARTDSGFEEHQRLLDLLVAFAAAETWPRGAFDPHPHRPYGVHCLHDDPAGWSLATVVFDVDDATPPHDHASWERLPRSSGSNAASGSPGAARTSSGPSTRSSSRGAPGISSRRAMSIRRQAPRAMGASPCTCWLAAATRRPSAARNRRTSVRPGAPAHRDHRPRTTAQNNRPEQPHSNYKATTR